MVESIVCSSLSKFLYVEDGGIHSVTEEHD